MARMTSWRAYATSVICAGGIGISTYMTLVHYEPSTVPLACPALGSGAINCLAVTTSAESSILGIPVAVLGLVFFVPMFVLCLPWAWRSERRMPAIARLAAAVTGIGFVAYLLYAELFEIHYLCLWCTGVHALTFLLFAIVVTGLEDATGSWYDADLEPAGD